MGISLPSSWIPGLQAATVLTLTAGFFFDQPLSLLLALAFAALVMSQDEQGVPAEFRPITSLLILSGLLFLAEYSTIAWGLALLCAAYALITLIGVRPKESLSQRLGERRAPSAREQQSLRRTLPSKRRR